MPRENSVRSPYALPSIRILTPQQPLQWLRLGWKDMKRNPWVSISYGLLIAALYAFVISYTLATRWYHVGLLLTAGFVLVAPLLALGFYNMSRAAQLGRKPTLSTAIDAWRINPVAILSMGVMLMLILLAWFMVSMWATAFLSQGKAALAVVVGPDVSWEMYRMLVTEQALPLLLGFFLTGLVAVLTVFAFTAVSLPLLLDKPETDAVSALVLSWSAVTRNWKPMLLWAAIIAGITTAGMLFFWFGLAVTLPLLGHATWHAYQDTLDV